MARTATSRCQVTGGDDARYRRGRVWPTSRRAGSRSSARPRASRSSRSPSDPRLGTLVGADDKFTAHNAASWQHGLLVRVPKGVVLEQPLYVRIANSSPDSSLFWRLLVVAEEGSRFTLIEEYSSVVARSRRLLERRRRALRRAGREARVRVAPEPLARDVALRHAPRARRARRRARLGRRRLRLEEGQDADPERPRRPGRDLARDRRVLRRRRAAPRLRHVPGAHRPAHDLGLRVQGRAPRPRDDGLARDDPRRAGRRSGRTPTRRTATCSSPRTRTRTRFPASRSSPTTCAARTARRSARSTATSSST